MSVTPQSLHYHLTRLVDSQKFLIAYSGGVDSHVLLHLCYQLKKHSLGKDLNFSAVYIDHGLSPYAQKWGEHCQRVCYELDIPLSIIEVNAQPEQGQSPEVAARKARYQAFHEILTDGECLLTAQHLDDQAETVLLQLMRGSGTRGLSAMPELKNFGKGWLCRPMLDVDKRSILAYAQQHQLHWVEDESNQEQRFDRNFLRHSILPELQKHWPSVQSNIARTASVLGESQYLLDIMAKEDFTAAVEFENEQQTADKLVLNKVRELVSLQASQASQALTDARFKLARMHNLLRYWIHLNDLPMPSKKILEQVVHNIVFSRNDASPVVCWKRDSFQCEIRKYRNTLYLINRTGQPVIAEQVRTQSYTLKPDQPVSLTGIGMICLELGSEELKQTIIVRFRQGGERFRKSRGAASSLLKHWFQEQGIPPWERDYMPLIFVDNELVQVGNCIVNKDFGNESGKPKVFVKSDHSLA